MKPTRRRYFPTSVHVEHQPGTPALALVDVSVYYDHRQVLDHLTMDVERGERLAVVGPNGAGKSTLFKLIAGVLEPTTGEIRVYGGLPGKHICIAYVPQRSQVDWNFPVNVSDVIMMGRVSKLGLFHQPRDTDRQVVAQCLQTVGLQDLAERQISELSGGQQQRMFIARALAQEAELILMDEPLNGLDMPAQENIFAILETLRRNKVTVMISTHDLNLAAERFDRVLLLNRQILGFGPADQVLSAENLVNAYGSHLRMIQTEKGLLALGDTCCDEKNHSHEHNL